MEETTPKELERFYNTKSRKEYVQELQEANPRVIRSFRKYLIEGQKCGGFAEACIRNNLSEAFGCADDDMRPLLHNVVMYMANCFPMDAWGSEDTYLKVVNDNGYFDDDKPISQIIRWAKRQGV